MADWVIDTLLDYAHGDDNVRAVQLEGSRAFGFVDEYSDHDIVFVTRDNAPFFDGAFIPFLVDNFGEIAVMQTPDNGDPRDVYTHLIQFANGVRIDITFNPVEFQDRVTLDSATVVILDKDERYTDLARPTDADFWLSKPSEQEYKEHCTEFYWVSPYVAKATIRGQTLHALEILGQWIRAEYAVMLGYLAGARNGWDRVNLGKDNTKIAQYLLPEDTPFLDILLDSYVPADPAEINRAFSQLVGAYGKLGATVANLLGYQFDNAEADRTCAFLESRFGLRVTS